MMRSPRYSMLAFQEGARIRPTIFIWGTITTSW